MYTDACAEERSAVQTLGAPNFTFQTLDGEYFTPGRREETVDFARAKQSNQLVFLRFDSFCR